MLAANKLSLNISKSHYIIFHRNKKFTYPLPPVKINSEIINEKLETKFLGVKIRKDLTWNSHINDVKAKVAKQCGILFLIRDSLDKQSRLLIYNSLIHSSLVYCISVWGGASAQALNSLVVTQKRAIRTIAGLRRRDHTYQAYADLKVSRLPDIIKQFAVTFVYK